MSQDKPKKYDPLRDHMATLEGSDWEASFAEIEHIIGSSLPRSARRYASFWQRNPGAHVWKQAWRQAGWEVESHDLSKARVRFRRWSESAPKET